MVVLLWSTTIMFSCNRAGSSEEVDLDTLRTQMSENLTMIYSENGKLSYRFETPLMERYELAAEPYMEFTRGVKVETYNDSTLTVESELIADYAKFLETQELWEARGNVVAKNKNGQILETEQLFWNQKTDRIYSNVESTIIQGNDIIVGTGFESDSNFDDFTFWKPKGQVEVNVDNERENNDSTSMETVVPEDMTASDTLSTIVIEEIVDETPMDSLIVE
ncbi:MAG: LPS export ABC transporter periplasmic protein LptC [Rikenellaceae bacterium]|nr:LPS export ABC transporter periplasmic protein LptC [Rikenellaceae bacterium]